MLLNQNRIRTLDIKILMKIYNEMDNWAIFVILNGHKQTVIIVYKIYKINSPN